MTVTFFSHLLTEHAFTHLTSSKTDLVFLKMSQNGEMQTQNMM